MPDSQCLSCGGVFSMGHVEVVARYADATVFKKPCCGGQSDDRTWVSQSWRPLRRERDIFGRGFPVFE